MTEIDRTAMVAMGNRLLDARTALGLSQEDVASKLGIGRPRYSDLENGKRDIPLKELRAFAEFFGRPLDYFLDVSDSSKEDGFKVLFRKSAGDQEVCRIVVEFENLCRNMMKLEELTGIKIKTQAPPDYDYDKTRLQFWGRSCARKERSRLNLGQEPQKDLDKILEEKCGLRIFYRDIPADKKIWGMFTYDARNGASMLINSNATPGRQLFSLAHEYAHFVFHKAKMGVISMDGGESASDERIADAFAEEFLMPESSVKEMFYRRTQTGAGVMAEDVLYLADYFGTSYKATVFSLNNLSLINNRKKDELLGRSVSATRAATGAVEPRKAGRRFPALYEHLCRRAYLQDRITVAKMAEYLDMPLHQAMELAGEIKGDGMA